jgi:hypothetical protein
VLERREAKRYLEAIYILFLRGRMAAVSFGAPNFHTS